MIKRQDEESGRYIQAVSSFFLEQRGAPFFLSVKEVEKMEEWRRMGIPVQIVREGIKACFETHRSSPGRKGKILSLAFCQGFILRGYQAYRERKVGGRRESSTEKDKREELKKAVERFLACCPGNLAGLKKVFSRVLRLIFENPDEEVLEDMELEVEKLIIRMASEADRGKISEEVAAEFGDMNAKEKERIMDLKLVKHMREKYAIPHVSLYYY